jgi:hypothetical protein
MRSRHTATPAGCAPHADERNRFAHRRARGNDVVHDQHPAGERRTHYRAALAVVLRLLAVVGVGHVATGACERHRAGGDEHDPLVRGPEEHVERDARLPDRECVKFRKPVEARPGVEQARIEEIRGRPAGFRHEAAETQHSVRDAEPNEVGAVVAHRRGLTAV